MLVVSAYRAETLKGIRKIFSKFLGLRRYGSDSEKLLILFTAVFPYGHYFIKHGKWQFRLSCLEYPLLTTGFQLRKATYTLCNSSMGLSFHQTGVCAANKPVSISLISESFQRITEWVMLPAKLSYSAIIAYFAVCAL